MIYNNQGGKIGFSSSSLPQTTKKLFTPIKLSMPVLSEVIIYKEKISLSKSNFYITKKKFKFTRKYSNKKAKNKKRNEKNKLF